MEPKNPEVIEFFSFYLDKFLGNSRVKELFNEESDEEFCENSLYKAVYDDPNFENVEFFIGTSRFVMVINDSFGYSYVLKIPFTANGVKGCRKEEKIWKDAEDCGLDFAFARTELFKSYDYKWRDGVREFTSLDVFICDRADVDLNTLESSASSSSSSDSDLNSETSDFDFDDPMTLADDAMVNEWGDFYPLLQNFLKLHKVNDLHMENVGYIDDKLVVIDYAGYNT